MNIYVEDANQRPVFKMAGFQLAVHHWLHSILEEISPGCSLEGLMLKLKLQSFGHMMRRSDSLEKTLMLGKIEAGGEGDNRG